MALGKERIKLTVQLGLVHTCLYKLLCCKVHMKKSESVPTLVTSWTVACSSVYGVLQARILEKPFSSTGTLPNPGIEPGLPILQADFFEPPGKSQSTYGLQ